MGKTGPINLFARAKKENPIGKDEILLSAPTRDPASSTAPSSSPSASKIHTDFPLPLELASPSSASQPALVSPVFPHRPLALGSHARSMPENIGPPDGARASTIPG